ncbi:MAG: hypothetical protein FWH15_09110 [Betaproteobacteria bacterium]|nr:hypothetical protein [Betaproteobacteria bacterium]
MNAPVKPDLPDNLPVLTEVVIPSSAAGVPESLVRTFIGYEYEDGINAIEVVHEPEQAIKAEEKEETGIDAVEETPEPEQIVQADDQAQSSAYCTFYEVTQADDDLATLILSEVRDRLVESLQNRFAAEIPTLVEAALHNAMPALIQEIREGLEENTKLALKDLFASLHETPSSENY